MEGADIVESPRKRQKVDNTSTADEATLPPSAAAPAEISESDAQALKEAEVGITEFVSAENAGFSGILKKRYFPQEMRGSRQLIGIVLISGIPISWSMRSFPRAKCCT